MLKPIQSKSSNWEALNTSIYCLQTKNLLLVSVFDAICFCFESLDINKITLVSFTIQLSFQEINYRYIIAGSYFKYISPTLCHYIMLTVITSRGELLFHEGLSFSFLSYSISCLTLSLSFSWWLSIFCSVKAPMFDSLSVSEEIDPPEATFGCLPVDFDSLKNEVWRVLSRLDKFIATKYDTPKYG